MLFLEYLHPAEKKGSVQTHVEERYPRNDKEERRGKQRKECGAKVSQQLRKFSWRSIRCGISLPVAPRIPFSPSCFYLLFPLLHTLRWARTLEMRERARHCVPGPCVLDRKENWSDYPMHVGRCSSRHGDAVISWVFFYDCVWEGKDFLIVWKEGFICFVLCRFYMIRDAVVCVFVVFCWWKWEWFTNCSCYRK